MNWYLEVLKKYAVFSGRARRKEYWMFVLFNMIIVFVLSFIEGMIGTTSSRNGQSILTNIYQLAVMIPSIAVGIRRMHDTDHSGWWLLFPIVNLIFAVSEGTHGDNKYGSDPKAISQTTNETQKEKTSTATNVSIPSQPSHAVEQPTGDYSLVKGQSGNVEGLWIRDPKIAQDGTMLLFLLMKAGIPKEVMTTIAMGYYRIDTQKNIVGCFVMWNVPLTETPPMPPFPPLFGQK